MKWFTKRWWNYLLAPATKEQEDIPTFTIIFCRARGHDPVEWYNDTTEPTPVCRTCKDNLR